MGDRLVPILISVIVHLAALALLTLSFSHRPEPPGQRPQSTAEPVEAVAVDRTKIEQELERIRAREARQQEEQRESERQAEKARREREREQKRIAELKRKREAERKARETEQKRLAKLKAEKEALAKQQAELEKKRQAEQKRLAEIEAKAKAEAGRREEEARRKAEAERKRLEEEKRRHEEELERQRAEQALKEKLAAEQKRLEAERNSQLLELQAQYEADIRNKVERNWLRPTGTDGTFSCKVLVRQLPGGDVVGVQLLESCGSPALDRSVENAVRKASPMPNPPDPELFDREIEFTFMTR